MSASFDPARFERIHSLLLSALADPSAAARDNAWYIALDRSRAELVDLGRPKPPSDVEKQEIEKGKLTWQGTVHDLNADFAQQTLILARSYGISERYAASLLQAGLSERARFRRPALDTACLLYHRERLALLACLKELVRGVITLADESDDVDGIDDDARRLGSKMEQLAVTLCSTPVELRQGAAATTKGKASSRGQLLERLLEELRFLRQQADTIRQQMTGGNGSATPALSDEIQLHRLECVEREAKEVGHVVYLLAIARLLRQPDSAEALASWLAALSPQDLEARATPVVYILTTLLAVIDGALSDSGFTQDALSGVDGPADKRDALMRLHAHLTTKTKWGDARLKGVVMLQWALLLVEAIRADPSLGTELRLSDQALQTIMTEAIEADALVFILMRVLAFRRKALADDDDEALDELNGNAAGADALALRGEADVDDEFQEYVLQQAQALVFKLTSTALPLLRRLQRTEEDAAFASSRAGSVAKPRAAARRYDIEALFDLVALICKGRAEVSLPLWLGLEGRGTTRFLAWAFDVREPGHQRALLEMLAALTAGPQSAWHAHTALSAASLNTADAGEGRLVSWQRLMDWIAFYVDAFRSLSSQQALAGMPPDEAVLLRAFLRLLRNVATHSVAAREALYEAADLTIVPRLFALYTCPIPVELKGALLDALAAFARSDGNNASRIVGDLWNMLEHSQVLGSAGGSAASKRSSLLRGSLTAPAPPTRGILFELENVESPSRSYPGTIAFINFLSALVPSSAPGQSPSELAAALTKPSSTSSSVIPRPAQQQQASYLGLVEPYVAFVVDSVLSTLNSREFATPRDRWQLVSACLGFVEKCLYTYDVSALSPDTKTEVLSAQLPALAAHPGFDILKRILTGGKLLGDILGVVNPAGGGAGFDIINAHRAGTPLFAMAVKSALRIVRRTLSVQDRYLRTLLPTLSGADGVATGASAADSVGNASPSAKVGQLSAYSSLDTHLLRAHQAVVQMALYVNCQSTDIALLSVRVLALIARSDAFSSVDRFGQMGYGRKMNRLVGLLDMSEEADRVSGGYVHWMDSVGEGTDVEDADAADESPLDALESPSPSAEEAIKLAILDLLLEQTSTDKPAPNVAWLLLGYNLRAARPEEQSVPDPDSDEAVRSVLHSVLQLLNSRSSTALASPAVLERGHALVLRLCSHPLTSAATLRYLRTREDFFARQVRRVTAAVKSPVPGSPARTAAPGTLVFSDGQSFPSTVDAIVSATRTKAHILNGAALELHTLCSTELLGPATHLVAALVGSAAVLPTSEAIGAGDETLDEVDDAGVDDAGLLPASSAFGGANVNQSSSRLLTLLQGFDFEWHDEREGLVSELNLLRELNLDLARLPGPEREFDPTATVHILSAARRELETRGDLADASRRAAFSREAEIVLAYVACRNAQRALALARRTALQAWRSSLDIIVARCSHLVRAEARIALAFDVLAGLLPKLAGPSPETDATLTDTFATAVLSLLTSLRQQQRGLVAAATIADHSLDLPADRLFQTLRSLLSALTQTGVLTASSRGNLYSALVNFLQLIQEAAQAGAGAEAADVESLLADDELTTLEDDGASLAGLSVAGTVTDRSSSAVLVSRTRNLIASQLDRLLPVVARDALDASDIWRTVAFTLLDRLGAVEFGKGPGAGGKTGSAAAAAAAIRSLEILGRSGLLRTFSASLRDMDAALQDVLRPDPVGLNALYVYEAQLAFLNRLALTKAGAARLIEDARIFEVLAQVDVLSARPEHGQDFIDLDSFLPAAMERYNAIVSPALQLAVSLLSSSASGASTSVPASNGLRASVAISAHAAPRQALAFLDAHHAAMLAILKAPLEETTSLASVTQAQLIVSLLTFVLPHLGDDALGGAGTLSSFHAAALALCAGFLQTPAWKGRVLPFTDSERSAASRPSVQGSALPSAAPSSAGDADRSEFDDDADDVVESLVSALLSYVVASTNVSAAMAVAPEPGKNLRIRSCLTPSLYAYSAADGMGMDEDVNGGGGGRFGLSSGLAARANAAAPTLGMALAALEGRGRAVTSALSKVETFNAMLVQPDAVRLEEWDEFLRRASASDDLPAGLSPAQRRTLAVRELKRRKHLLLARSVTRLDDMEKLLVILFRHFDYFLSLPATTLLADSEARRRGLAGARASVAPGAGGGGADAGGPSSRRLAFVRESATRVKDALQDVEQAIIALGTSASTALGRGRVRERQAFLEMAGRKLGGVLLEHEEAASAMT